MALRKYIAEEGKVWKSKLTGDILSNEIYLGVNDSIDNYEQILYTEIENINLSKNNEK